MAWNNVRKEDKPYSFEQEGLVLIEYQSGGKLYLADNRDNLCISEDDYLAVSYLPANEDDKRLPIVAVRSLGITSKHFTEVCNWINFNPKTNDDNVLPRYHEENVIKNISRDGTNDDDECGGGIIIISVNPATGEEIKTGASLPFNLPGMPEQIPEEKPENTPEDADKPENKPEEEPEDKPETESENESGNDPEDEAEDEHGGNGVNESEQSHYDEYDDFLEELNNPQEESVEIDLNNRPDSIFTFIKKVH